MIRDYLHFSLSSLPRPHLVAQTATIADAPSGRSSPGTAAASGRSPAPAASEDERRI